GVVDLLTARDEGHAGCAVGLDNVFNRGLALEHLEQTEIVLQPQDDMERGPAPIAIEQQGRDTGLCRSSCERQSRARLSLTRSGRSNQDDARRLLRQIDG